MTLAFKGIRVLDFSQVVAGPVTGQLLCQLGAEIIKIERRDGDQLRALFKGGKEAEGHPSEAFATLNRGKRLISIDLKSEAGKAAAMRLAKDCDVVLENFRPGAMNRLGLDYDAFRAVKPDIIYCSISGFGQEGPASLRPAYDGVIQATSGMMMGNGHAETGPTRASYLPVDHSTGFMAAFAISSALLRKERTGEGQRVDVAMIDTALFFQSCNMSRYLAGGGTPPLMGNRSGVGWPVSDCFRTTDGHIVPSAAAMKQALAILDVIGLPHSIIDDYEKVSPLSDEATAISNSIRAIFEQNSCDHWISALTERGVPVERVLDLDDAAKMEQLQHRDILRAPTVEDGSACDLVYGGVFLANEDGPEVRGKVAEIGAETVGVLSESGFSDDEIDALRAAGAIV